MHYPNGDRSADVSIWFRCRAVGGQARVADDESLEVHWFASADLPELSDWARRLIDIAVKDDEAAWFAQPGSSDGDFKSF